MQYRRLGDAGLKVSTIAFGGWINFGSDTISEHIARQTISAAYESGINYFDLADIYANGRAETQMGQILSQYPRHSLVIATKVFWPMSDEVNDRGLSRKHIMESIAKSLRRLQTDYVDLYFCHRPDPNTPLLETARAMDDLVHQGKVLYWGTSEWSGAQISEVLQLCARYNLYPPQVEQPNYSLLNRQRVEAEIVPVTEPGGMGLVVFSPLAQGMLTGKYDEGIPDGSRFARETWAKERFMTDANVTKVRQLAPIAAELGITRGQLALAWVLRQPGISSAIIGATRSEQVRENVIASDVTLNDEVVAQIEAIVSAE